MIEISIPRNVMERYNNNEVLFNVHVVTQLKLKGVPIIGTISIQGVENGELSMAVDPITKNLVYRWKGTPNKPATPPPDDDEL